MIRICKLCDIFISIFAFLFKFIEKDEKEIILNVVNRIFYFSIKVIIQVLINVS